MTWPGTWLSNAVLFVGAMASVAPAAADWSARRVYDPFTDQSRCVAESDVVSLHDGYQETRLRLRVDQQSVAVVTESNIDGSRSDAGISVDGQPLIAIDSIVLEQTAIVRAGATVLVKQFKSGREASIRLHFWPTWAPRGLRSATVNLNGFSRAYSRLPDCS